MILLIILSFLFTFLSFIFLIRFLNKSNTQHCKCTSSLEGKVIVMTGANTGIGLEAAISLSMRNAAKIIIGCRNIIQTKQEIDNLKRNKVFNNNTTIIIKELDLLSLTNVRNFAEDIINGENRIDILVLNAGAGCFFGKHLTEDLLEQQFQSNHLAHFLLFKLLKQKMIDSSRNYSYEPSRIIVTSSLAHHFGKIDLDNISTAKNYIQHPFSIYSNTKLANVLFTKELARRLKQDCLENNLIVSCFSPGNIYTNGVKYNKIWYLKLALTFLCFVYNRSSHDAAENIVHLCLSREYQILNGSYYSNCKITRHSSKANDTKLAKKFWQLSETVCEQQLFK